MTPPRNARWLTSRLDDVGPRADLAWALGQRITIPAALVESGGVGISDNDGIHVLQQIAGTAEDVEGLRLRAAFTNKRPLSSLLPFSYQRVNPRIRSLIAKGLGLTSRLSTKPITSAGSSFPDFPLDLSADFLADLAGGPPSCCDKPTPVVLTHDLDSHEGLINFISRFAPLEEEFGGRSSNFVPACAWPLDHERLTSLRKLGHEVGVHGFDHSNRTAFLPQTKRDQRLDAATPLWKQYDATGYRAPSLLRTRILLASLAGRYQYDSSIPTAGGLFPVPNNGCATARPFIVEGIAELPLSMPRDGSLRFLGYSPEAIFRIWLECADRIAASGGVVVLLTHCEDRFSGNDAMLKTYRSFLEYVAKSKQYFFSTPINVLRQANLIPQHRENNT